MGWWSAIGGSLGVADRAVDPDELRARDWRRVDDLAGRDARFSAGRD
jgi:hypothetical protein